MHTICRLTIGLRAHEHMAFEEIMTVSLDYPLLIKCSANTFSIISFVCKQALDLSRVFISYNKP